MLDDNGDEWGPRNKKQKSFIIPSTTKDCWEQKVLLAIKVNSLGAPTVTVSSTVPWSWGCLASFSTLFFQNSFFFFFNVHLTCHECHSIILFFPQGERWKKTANFIIISGTCVCRGLRLAYLEGTCDGVVICCPQRSPAPVGLTYNDEHVPQGPGSSPYWLWEGQEEPLAPGSTPARQLALWNCFR